MLIFSMFPPLVFADAVAGKKKSEVCVVCHDIAREDKLLVPVLEGQPREFFIAQIAAFRTKLRTELNMDVMTRNLNTTDIDDLADYFAAQEPARPPLHVDAKLAAAGAMKLHELHCSACHQPTYAGQGAAARLAGQKPKYTAWTLLMIGLGKRHHPAEAMPEIKSLTGEDIDHIAHALASMRSHSDVEQMRHDR